MTDLGGAGEQSPPVNLPPGELERSLADTFADTPSAPADQRPNDAVPSRRRIGVGGIIAIVVAGVLVAGALVVGSLVLASRGGEEQAAAPSRSAEPTTSSSATATATTERDLSATGEVPFADGRWALYIPASWNKSASEDAIVNELPDGVYIVGIWQITDSPNDLAFVGALPAVGVTDEAFEATATNSSLGIKVLAVDSSTSEPEWSTTVGGYRQVTVVTNAVFEDGSTGTQVGSLVILDDYAIYIVSTSFEPHFIGTSAVETIANSIE